jgi:hypothetical protein
LETPVYIVRVAEKEWDILWNHSAYLDKNRAEKAATNLRLITVTEHDFLYADVKVQSVPLR